MSVSCECGVLSEVSALGRSLVKRSPTESGVSECYREASIMRSPWPHWGLLHQGKEKGAVSVFRNSDWATDWKLRGSNHLRAKRVFSKTSTPAVVPK
jgi:hypothetical protein